MAARASNTGPPEPRSYTVPRSGGRGRTGRRTNSSFGSSPNPANGKWVVSIPFGVSANHFPTPSAADGLLLLPGTSQVFAFMGPAELPPTPPLAETCGPHGQRWTFQILLRANGVPRRFRVHGPLQAPHYCHDQRSLPHVKPGDGPSDDHAPDLRRALENGRHRTSKCAPRTASRSDQTGSSSALICAPAGHRSPESAAGSPDVDARPG